MPVLLEFSEKYAERIKKALHPYSPDEDRQDFVIMKKEGDHYLLITENEVLSNEGEYVSIPDHLFKILVDAEAIQILNRAEYHYHLAILSAAVGLAEGGLWSALPDGLSQAALVSLVAPTTAILSLVMELLYYKYKHGKWPARKELTAMISDSKLTCVQIVLDVLGELLGNGLATTSSPILNLIIPSIGSASFVTTAVFFTESPINDVKATEEKETIMRAVGFFEQNGELRRRVRAVANNGEIEKVIPIQKKPRLNFSFLRDSNSGIFFGSGVSTGVWAAIGPLINALGPEDSILAKYFYRPALMSIATGAAFGFSVLAYNKTAQMPCFQGNDPVNELLLEEQSKLTSEDEEAASNSGDERALLASGQSSTSYGSAGGV